MTLLELASISTTILFGALSVFLSIKEEKLRKAHKKELQTKEDAVNMIIHDLKAPLTAIKDSAALLMQSDNLTNDEKDGLLKLTYEQAKKLLNQVSSLLDASKLQAGLFTIDKVPDNLKKTIEKQAEVFIPEAKTRDIEIIVDIPTSLPTVSFDAIRIGEVISNLISNSLKFTPAKGKITVNAKQATFNAKPYVLVSVTDTGMGLPKDKQKELFSRFSKTSTPLLNYAKKRQTPTGSQIIEGTGLGLFITKGIVEAHGGSIVLESEENKGTTVSFTLPIS